MTSPAYYQIDATGHDVRDLFRHLWRVCPAYYEALQGDCGLDSALRAEHFNALRYVVRAHQKGETPEAVLSDLRKAINCLKTQIRLIEAWGCKDSGPTESMTLDLDALIEEAAELEGAAQQADVLREAGMEAVKQADASAPQPPGEIARQRGEPLAKHEAHRASPSQAHDTPLAVLPTHVRTAFEGVVAIEEQRLGHPLGTDDKLRLRADFHAFNIRADMPWDDALPIIQRLWPGRWTVPPCGDGMP